LQCVAVCCSVLQCVAETHIPELTAQHQSKRPKCVAACCSVLQCVAVCCSGAYTRTYGAAPANELSVLQCVAETHVPELTAQHQSKQLKCVVVYCSVLQCVAVCCSVLQRCIRQNIRRSTEAYEQSVLQCVAVRCSVSQRVEVFGNVLQCVAVCCSVLQCVAEVHIPEQTAQHGGKQVDLQRQRAFWCQVLQIVAVVLQCVAVVLRCVAVRMYG